MRKFLLSCFILLTALSMHAQIVSGSKLTSNIKTKDIKGNNVDIFADLDAGKTVIIDVFATWCGPCWSFHKSEVFKILYAEYGPNGTDQLRAYGLEADGSTALDLLYKEVINGQNVDSWGDWTAGVEYPIINDHSFNDLLKITYFPTLYVIRPDRTVMEMGNYRNNFDIWKKAMFPTAEKDLFFVDNVNEKTFCKTTIFAQKPKVINMGSTNISNINASISFNGDEKLSLFNTPIGVFQEATLNFGNKTLEATTEVAIKIEDIDDVAGEYGEIKGTLYRPEIAEDQFTVLFTTDFYPSETSWEIKDNKNRSVFKQPNYRAGTADQYGGGGPDANKEFEYKITLPSKVDVNCLTMTINDVYKDGMPYFPEAGPVPGVIILDSKGNVIKPKMVSDFVFEAAAKIYVSADFTTSLEDLPFVEGVKIYPNPVADILNVELQVKEGVEYQLFVTDVMGKQVSDINKNANFINVASLSSGIYFLNVRTNDGVYTHKFNKI